MPDRSCLRWILEGLRTPFCFCAPALLLTLGSTALAADEAAGLPREEVPEDRGYLAYPVRFMQRSTAEALSFDPATDPPATIRYKLTKTGRVRLRAVWRSDKALVLRTLQDWTEQGFAVHEVTWDGRDASGNIVDNSRCFIAFEEDSRLHGKHPREGCRELELSVSGLSPDGKAVSTERIRVSIDEGAAPPPQGYGVRVYVDYKEAARFALPAGDRRFALPDLPGTESGSPLITVNVDDGRDHVGVAGFRIER